MELPEPARVPQSFDGREELHEVAARRGPDTIGAKLREEAAELADAIKSESDERVLSEPPTFCTTPWSAHAARLTLRRLSKCSPNAPTGVVTPRRPAAKEGRFARTTRHRQSSL